MVQWHALDKKEIFDLLHTNENGLSSAEVSNRLSKYGKNELKQISKINPLFIFLQQFKSVLIAILIFAAAFSFFIKHYLDFWAILVIVLLNASIGFFQQYRAEKAIFKMKNILVPKVTVFRNGRLEEINSLDLVPGDVIQISEGDKVMADCRIILNNEIEMNESILTGESLPEKKTSEKLKLDVELGDRVNMLYMGTSVVKGSGKAVVVFTGMNTEFGKIAGLVQTIKIEKTPLENKLDDFSKKIAVIVLILALISVGVGIYRGEDIFDMLLVGVALAVSAIPEGVPTIIAITLALAIGRMQKNNALIRKLPAAETLGRTTVICTDKTGTLTEENMTVTKIFTGSNFYTIKDHSFYNGNQKVDVLKNFNIKQLLRIGILCNNAHIEKDAHGNLIRVLGDPTEKSLIISAEKAGILKKEETEKESRIIEYAFTSKRKLMSLIRESDHGLVSYVKGAPDILLKQCVKEYYNGRIIHLTDKRKKELITIYNNMASHALRVLGFAYREISGKYNQDIAEKDLIFVGFQGIIDPPRKEVAQAIKECLEAGIKIKMITGDSLLTAKAVSEMVGLSGESIEESEIAKLSEEEFYDTVRDKTIFARVTPETKLRIIQTLKNQDEIVAVTGDGVNDVLALKEAHIGVAMGIRGSEVARDVSDIILLDDNFASIVSAIKEGRKVYSNLKKSIKAHISANVSELFIVLFALIAYLPLPLMPLGILWMNLITDSFPSIALAVEPEDVDIMKRKPLDKKETILTGIMGFLVTVGVLSFIITLGLFLFFYQQDLARARTIALTAAVFCQMFIIFSCRSQKNIWEIGFFSNKLLIGAVFFAVGLQLLAIFTPLNHVLGLVPISLGDIALCALLSSIIFILFEIKKFIVSRKA